MSVSSHIGEPLGDAMSLAGRTAVIVGACRHVGHEVAHRLAAAGASVVVANADAELAQAGADAIASPGEASAPVLGTEAADPRAMREIADRAVAEFGRLDVWVHVAGARPQLPEPRRRARDQLSLSTAWGGYLGVRAVALRMSAVAGGVIVNVAPWPCCGARSEDAALCLTSDRGLAGLTTRMAVEFEPFGVRVFGIVPSITDGSALDRLAPGCCQAAAGDLVESVVVRLPLGSGEGPDDVAGAVLFCASDLSMFMSGSTLLVPALT